METVRNKPLFMSPKFEATLRNWRFETLASSRALVAVGNVYGHPNFKDGKEVHTSLIQQLRMTDENNGFIETLNTYYHLYGGDSNG